MSTQTIARRYSSALADVALKQGEAETIKTELAMFEQLVAGNADLSNVLSNPAIPHSKKEKPIKLYGTSQLSGQKARPQIAA